MTAFLWLLLLSTLYSMQPLNFNVKDTGIHLIFEMVASVRDDIGTDEIVSRIEEILVTNRLYFPTPNLYAVEDLDIDIGLNNYHAVRISLYS